MKAFYAHKKWREDHGFPPQILPRRWRASQIERWEAARMAGQETTPPPANDIGPDHAPGTAREKLAALRARTQGAAHG